MLTPGAAVAIESVLSVPRLQRFMMPPNYTTRVKALQLYQWNAEISAAFMVPLHICEVSVRNGISDTIERVYGPTWWAAGSGFERSLSDPARAYSPRRDLERARRGHVTAGKVVAELKFMFWISLLTSRFEGRLWSRWIGTYFPNLPPHLALGQRRQELYGQLNVVRILRNRIAHHEPIFPRNLADDYARISKIIAWRSMEAAAWLDSIEAVSLLLASKP